MRFLILAGILLALGEFGDHRAQAAADVTNCYVAKGLIYAQTNALAPVPKAGPSVFQVEIRTSASFGAVYSLAMRVPGAGGGFPRFLIPTGPQQHVYGSTEVRASQTLTDQAYPDGIYRFDYNTVHSGWRTNVLALTGSTYPSIPRVVNYDAAQVIDPAVDFTLQWAPFSGGTSNDVISVVIYGGTANSGVALATSYLPGQAGTLNGLQTNLVIRAGTLQPGRSYVGRLRFDRVVGRDTTNFAGCVAASAYFRSTDFRLLTVGATPDTEPRVIAVSPPPGATGIPRDAPLIWTFNKPMGGGFGYAVGGLPGQVTNYTSFWSTDRRSFIRMPLTAAGTNLNASWNLQHWSSFLGFRDPDGNPLFPDTAGAYVTGSSLLSSAERPSLKAQTGSPAAFKFRLTGPTNRVYVIEGSTNHVNWTGLSTNIVHPALPVPSVPGSGRQRWFRARTW